MWFKVDDRLHSHPKALATPLAALGLWTLAGSWSGDHLTDGFVSDQAVSQLSRGTNELADELVAAGLWRRVRGGYRFHDWTDRNPSKEEVEAERRRKAEAGRLGGIASGRARRGESVQKPFKKVSKPVTRRGRNPTDDTTGLALSSANAEAHAKATAQARASPVLPEVPNPRPSPSSKEEGSGGERAAPSAAPLAPTPNPPATPVPSSNGKPVALLAEARAKAAQAAKRTRAAAAKRANPLAELRTATEVAP